MLGRGLALKLCTGEGSCPEVCSGIGWPSPRLGLGGCSSGISVIYPSWLGGWVVGSCPAQLPLPWLAFSGCQPFVVHAGWCYRTRV